MYKIFEKILHGIINIAIVLIFLLVIIVAYNYIQLRVLNKSYTNFFGYSIFEVSTGSMAKTLNVYDVVIVKITKEVSEQDIITYSKDGELITHRIMRINEDEIVTKGDANNSEDKVIHKDDVIGKVVFVCPKLGIWGKVLTDYKVLISIFVTIILVGLATRRDIKEE